MVTLWRSIAGIDSYERRELTRLVTQDAKLPLTVPRVTVFRHRRHELETLISKQSNFPRFLRLIKTSDRAPKEAKEQQGKSK